MSPISDAQNGPQVCEVQAPNTPVHVPLVDVPLAVQQVRGFLSQPIPPGLRDAILRKFISQSPVRSPLPELVPRSRQHSPPPSSTPSYQAMPPQQPYSHSDETASRLAKERAHQLWAEKLRQEQNQRANEIIDNFQRKHVQVDQLEKYCGFTTKQTSAQRFPKGHYGQVQAPQGYYGQGHSPYANGVTPTRVGASTTSRGPHQQTLPPQVYTPNSHQQQIVNGQQVRQQPQHSPPSGYYPREYAKQPDSRHPFRNTSPQAPQKDIPAGYIHTKQGVIRNPRHPAASDPSTTQSPQGLTISPLNFPLIYIIPILLPRSILQILNDFLTEQHQYKLSLLDMDPYDAEMQQRYKRMYPYSYHPPTYELLFSPHMELPRVYAPCQVIGIVVKTAEGNFLGNARRLKLEEGDRKALCSRLMDASSRRALDGGRRLDETDGDEAVKAEFELFSGMAKRQLACFID